jgi:hypothetical protein
MNDNEETMVLKRLTSLGVPQLVHLIRQLGLRDEFMDNITTIAIIIASDQIIKLTKSQYGKEWKLAIENAIDDLLLKDGKTYWERKLEHLKGYLIDPSEPEYDKSRALLGVGNLREQLDASAKYGEFEKPQLIRVKGTLFPAALLGAGWWEKLKKTTNSSIRWRDEIKGGNSLQQWLFEGFDMWAPSWDVSWDFEGRESEPKQYYIAQLADGDEANSLPVIIPQKLAIEWREKFKKSWGGLEVEITGLLGYKSQARKAMPAVKDEIKGKAEDYCIWLKDDDDKYKIQEHKKTNLYSGYLWQCWIPKKWQEERDENNEPLELEDVYIVWEHTNFAASNARNYNLSSLNDKVSYIEKSHPEYGGLILLQKSHALVPGDPLWPVKDFYELLLS